MQTLLGVVTGTNRDRHGEPVAWVKPLFEITGSWREADPEEFPTRGFLFWPQAKDAVRDGLVFVKPRENSVRLPGLKDDFMVADPHPALEVVDLRKLGDEEHARVALDAGIRLSGVPAGRALIWCGDNTVLGPVALVVAQSGIITVEHANRARIPCFRLKQSDIRTVTHDGLTRHVVARPTLGQPDGFVDWDDDKLVVRRALDFAVGVAKRSGAVRLTKQMIDDAAEQIAANNSPPETALESYRLQRTKRLMKGLDTANRLASEVASALQAHPAVAKEIDALKAQERQAARRQTEASLKNEQEKIENVRKERENAETALRELERIAKEREAAIISRATEIEKAVHEKIAEAVASAPALLAEVALLKPFIGGSAAPVLEARTDFKYPEWKKGEIRLATIKDLRARISPLMKSAGVAPQTWQRIHAAIAARLLPVVAGPRATEALLAYAHAATAGRVAVVQVTTALSDVKDIFGCVDTGTRSFIPHPAGLIDIVAAAQASDGLMLIVLDGVNRGATESYLLPLLRSALRRSSPISLFHPSAVDSRDPYSAYARIEWPKNLLLAATVVEGPTSLPVSPDIWADSVLVQTDLQDVPAATGRSSSLPPVSEIEPESDVFSPRLDDVGVSAGLENLLRAASLRWVATRFESALKLIQNDQSALECEIVNAVVLPSIAAIDDEEKRGAALADLKKALGPKNAVGISDAVDVARRRIA